MSPLRSHRRDALRLLLGGAALALAACGRRGAPLPPYDVDPCYPRHYPMAEGTKQLCAQKEEYAREHPPQPRPPKGKKKSDTPAEQTPAAEPAQPQSDQLKPGQPQEQAPANPPSDSKPQ